MSKWLESSPIGKAIVEQSETILLLSNPKAKKADYCDHLNMSEEEFNFVVTTKPDDYHFLIEMDISRAEKYEKIRDYYRIEQ